ncbi:MAG: hypothetical protein ACPLRZ_08315 [Thermovenabulum sp.]|uniref:hypothetical protein n=1 Tax=Thermovenabulum sp. TaxID=3100335 RepID=UPI003C7E3C0F
MKKACYNITIDSEILHHFFVKGTKNEGMAKPLELVFIVTAWNSRLLREKSFLFVIVDAMAVGSRTGKAR